MNASALQAKKDSVKEIRAGLKDAKLLAIVGYQGLTVQEISDLRHQLAEKGARLSVCKNTLVRRALKDEKVAGLDEYLEGPNAFVFSEEIAPVAKILHKFSRYHEVLVLKGAYVEGTAIDGKGLKDLAKLPSKEQLLSMFCMVLNEPVAGFARAIKSVADKAEAPAPAAN